MAKNLKPEWVKGPIAAEELGCCVEHLHRLRKDGTLKNRVHFKDISGKRSMRPTWRYNLTAIRRDFG